MLTILSDLDVTVGEGAPSCSGTATVQCSSRPQRQRDEDTRAENSPSQPGMAATISAVGARVRESSADTGQHTEDERPHSRTSLSPVDALNLEEVARTRIFLRSSVVTCVVTLPILPALGGSGFVRLLLAFCLGICAVASAWLYVRIRRHAAAYTPARATIVMAICAVTANVAVLYWGVFSAAQIAVIILLYVFSRGRTSLGALLVYVVCAGGQAGLAVMILSGVIADPGLLGANAATHQLIITHALGQMFYLFTYLSGRLIRREAIGALGKLEEAARQVAQREALLQEARDELNRARRAGGPGRYSELVIGDYRVGEVLGRGAMGEVYEAVHVETGCAAAAKFLRPDVLADPRYVRRFLREARIAASLQLPNTVGLLDTSEPGDPLPYLVFERLHGENLAERLSRGRLGVEEASLMVRQVGAVLDAARDQGIVHRDIKPQNIFIVRDAPQNATWRVLDFGVSLLTKELSTLTQGNVVGTPAYMAPEQASGRRVDHRADVYALAAVLYRSLTGHPPFVGDDMASVLYNVVNKAPPRPTFLAKELPLEIDVVLALGLAKTPRQRLQTAGQLASTFAQAVDNDLPADLRARGANAMRRWGWGHRSKSRMPTRREQKL